MKKPLVVNIINFIRAVEPRGYVDLVEPVVRQIELVKKHRMPATWLLQYDALITAPYADILKTLGDDQEIGGWFEVVQPLVEKAGLPWRGRYPWDWHSHVGFSVGYSPAEREKLIDIYMADFKQTFGTTPATMGSWLMDAHTLGYLHDRYGVIGSCNCKDQLGTDGYTLWGGYWNQAFYPSRRNAYMPAQTEAGQIPIPIFRMLGSDPVDQYDAVMHGGSNCSEVESQAVVSLEPAYREGGGSPAWVRWFFRELEQNPSLAFQYAQVGQENSFGWASMKEGLTFQLEYLAERRETDSTLRIETLKSSSQWFRKTYPLTPASSISATSDSRGNNRGSAWYNSRFYRANLYWSDGEFRIRDLHLFEEDYPERYLETACLSSACVYDTIPVCEGFHWSDRSTKSGLRLTTTQGPLLLGTPTLEDQGNGRLSLRWTGLANSPRIDLQEEEFTLFFSGKDQFLECVWGEGKQVPFQGIEGRMILLRHEGYSCSILLSRGRIEIDHSQRTLRIHPEDREIKIHFAGR